MNAHQTAKQEVKNSMINVLKEFKEQELENLHEGKLEFRIGAKDQEDE